MRHVQYDVCIVGCMYTNLGVFCFHCKLSFDKLSHIAHANVATKSASVYFQEYAIATMLINSCMACMAGVKVLLKPKAIHVL